MIRQDHPMNRYHTLLPRLIITSPGTVFYDSGHMRDAFDVFCYPPQ
jgi:hypothetical protein